MTSPKNTVRKPRSRPTAGKKNKTAAAMAEIQAALPNANAMQAFHAADALAKQMYPVRVFDSKYALSQMLYGLTTAMNLFSTAYMKGLELVKTHVTPAIKDNAVYCAVNTVSEQELVQLNVKIMGLVDTIGMPLSVRGPFVRDIPVMQHFIGTVRNEFYHIERAMSLDDVSRYYYAAFFSMTPVRLFLQEDPTPELRLLELLGQCGPSVFLDFVDNEVEVLNGANAIIMANPLWRMAGDVRAEIVDALEQFSSTVDAEGTPLMDLVKELDGSGNHAEAHLKLVEFIIQQAQTA